MQLSLMFAVLSSDRESSQRKLGEDSPGRDQLGAKACVSHRFSMSRSLRSRFGTGYNSSEGPIASAWARAALGFHLLPSLLVLLARSCSTCVARELLWILDGPNDWFPGLAPSPAPPLKRGAQNLRRWSACSTLVQEDSIDACVLRWTMSRIFPLVTMVKLTSSGMKSYTEGSPLLFSRRSAVALATPQPLYRFQGSTPCVCDLLYLFLPFTAPPFALAPPFAARLSSRVHICHLRPFFAS